MVDPILKRISKPDGSISVAALMEELINSRARVMRLEAEARDARYLVAALVKAAGGRVELSMVTVMGIGAKDQITHWDDPISGNKVYVLTEATTSDAESKSVLSTNDTEVKHD